MDKNDASPGTSATSTKNQPAHRGQGRENTPYDDLDAIDKEDSPSSLPELLEQLPYNPSLQEVARRYRDWKRGEGVDDGGAE